MTTTILPLSLDVTLLNHNNGLMPLIVQAGEATEVVVTPAFVAFYWGKTCTVATHVCTLGQAVLWMAMGTRWCVGVRSLSPGMDWEGFVIACSSQEQSEKIKMSIRIAVTMSVFACDREKAEAYFTMWAERGRAVQGGRITYAEWDAKHPEIITPEYREIIRLANAKYGVRSTTYTKELQ